MLEEGLDLAPEITVEEPPAPEDNGLPVYFANMHGAELATELMERVENYYTYVQTEGIFSKIEAAYDCYRGKAFSSVPGNSAELTKTGSRDEIVRMRVNHWRNIVLHQTSLATNELPVPKAICTNTDHRTIGQAQLGDGINDHYRRKLDLDEVFREASRGAIKYGSYYMLREWDVGLGESAPTATSGFNGDFRVRLVHPLDVVIDPYLDNYKDCQWWIVRTWISKFELAAAYPQLAEKLLSLDTKEDEWRRYRIGAARVETDLVAVYQLLHNKTAAVPEGRHFIFCDEDIVLHDDTLAYRKARIYRINPDTVDGTPFGDTVMFDLLSIQEAIDHLYSIVVTNQKTFGLQVVMEPEGANLTIKFLGQGLARLKYLPVNGQKPEVLSFLSTPKEIFEFIRQLEMVMETLSAINAVTRGNAPTNLETGSALALIESRAHAFLAGLMKGLKSVIQDFYHGMLEDFQDFATIEHKIVVSGQSNQFTVQSLTGEDIKDLSMVEMEAVNPAFATYAAKMDAADKLLAQNLITPQQYMAIRKTGNLDLGSERPDKENQLIRKENELLEQGQPAPMPAITDQHLQHIQEHSCVIADPLVRASRPDIIQATLDHLTAHIQLLATPMPILQNLLLATGQTPLLLPPMPPEQAAGGSAPKPPGHEKQAGEMPSQPNLPQMPKNSPQAGENYNPATGNAPQ
jgi:hypothetical protein